MLVASYKTKKDLKAAIGQELRYVETSLHGPGFRPGTTFAVVGPSPYDRKWYAQVTVDSNGIIQKVK